MIQLAHKPMVLGTGYHRSGWPFAYDALKQLPQTDADIWLDDFVEQTWVYSGRREPITQPWAGIFHHPPHPPTWTRQQDRLDRLREIPAFAESMRYMDVAICLSHYVAEWIEENWKVPTAVVKHPTEVPDMQWQPQTWRNDKRLLQCGWYLRNVRLIHQIDTSIHRTRLMTKRPATAEHEKNCIREFDRAEARPSDVLPIGWVEDAPYDWLLSRSVVCMEVLDASANNVTIECIARNTPLIVNRHPAVVEYLGEGYPLFFEDYRAIAAMLDDEDLIMSGHQYLTQLDKTYLSPHVFREGIVAALGAVR